MKGYANLIPTTEPVAFRLTPEEKAWLRKMVKSCAREGDVCQADVLRVAFTRLMAGARKRGFRQGLIKQIQNTKGAGQGKENARVDFEADVTSTTTTEYPIQMDGGIRGSEVELSPSNTICK